MKKKITIILPVFNEEKSIQPLFGLLKEKQAVLGCNLEIIFIDDGSTDKSLEKMKNVKRKKIKNIHVKIISFADNYGKTEALKAAIKVASGDYLAMLDADLQDDPIYLLKFLEKIEKENLDFVIGWRKDRYRDNLIKNLSSKLVNYTMAAFVRYRVHDMNCGFKFMKIEVARKLHLKSDFHRFIPLLVMINGFRVGELVISQKKRQFGVSKYGSSGLKRLVKSVVDMTSILFIYKFRENPFSLFGRVGFLFNFIGFIILLALTVLWFMGQSIGSRPLFFLGVLLMILGTNLIGLGLLGELIVGNKNEDRHIIKEYLE